MKMLPPSAAMKASARKVSCEAASAVPTSTGAIAAGSVRGRAATSQIRNGALPAPVSRIDASIIGVAPGRLRTTGEAREIRFALLDVGVAAFLPLLGHVKEHRRVACELLQAGEPVRVCIEGTLQ